MGAHAVITPALNQGGGVSLAKITDAPSVPLVKRSPVRDVDVAPYFAWVDGVALEAHAWWGVPAHVVRGWIAQHLVAGNYARASFLSGLVHA